MYNVVEYWSKRKDPNRADSTLNPRILSYVKKHVNKNDIILDFGPGVGRLFEAYGLSSYVEGYDITDRHKEVLLIKSKSLRLNFELTVGDGIEKLPYTDDQFNIAMAIQVLLHQKPEDISFIMSELARVAVRVLVVTWMEKNRSFDYKINNTNAYCFHHNYLELCETNDWKISNFISYKKHVMFIYNK